MPKSIRRLKKRHSKRVRTPAEKAAQRRRTANNKLKRIKKSLETASGQAVEKLKERQEFWIRQLHNL